MASKSQFASQLASLGKTWAGAKAKQDEMFGGQQLPAAQYTAQLVGCKLILTKQSQKLAVTRNFLIVDGEYEGKTISDMMGLNFNELSPVFLRRWIEQMGYAAPEDLAAELENVLQAIGKDANYVKIKVRLSGQYYNIDVLETWSSKDETGEGESEAAPEGEGEAEADVGEAGASEGEGGEADDPETLAALMLFGSSQDLGDVTISDEDTIDSIKEKLSDFTWKPEELAEGEGDLLESVGLGDLIVKPEPAAKAKPAPKGKAAPAAPAKASAPAKAAPAKAAPAKPSPKKK